MEDDTNDEGGHMESTGPASLLELGGNSSPQSHEEGIPGPATPLLESGHLLPSGESTPREQEIPVEREVHEASILGGDATGEAKEEIGVQLRPLLYVALLDKKKRDPREDSATLSPASCRAWSISGTCGVSCAHGFGNGVY